MKNSPTTQKPVEHFNNLMPDSRQKIDSNNLSSTAASSLTSALIRDSKATPSVNVATWGHVKKIRFTETYLRDIISSVTGKTKNQVLTKSDLQKLFVHLNQDKGSKEVDLGVYKNSNHYVVGAGLEQPTIPSALVDVLKENVSSQSTVAFASRSSLNGEKLSDDDIKNDIALQRLAASIAKDSHNKNGHKVVVHYTPAAHGSVQNSLDNIKNAEVFMTYLANQGANMKQIKIALLSTQATRPHDVKDPGYKISEFNVHYALSKIGQEAIFSGNNELSTEVNQLLDFFIQHGDPANFDKITGKGSWANEKIFNPNKPYSEWEPNTQHFKPELKQQLMNEIIPKVSALSIKASLLRANNPDGPSVSDSLTIIPTILHVGRKANTTVNSFVAWLTKAHQDNQAGVMTTQMASVEHIKALTQHAA